MSRHVRIRLLLAAAVVVIAGAVWLAGASQIAAANGSFNEIEAAHGMHGHGKGDEVLAAVGDTVASVVRDSDFVGRYGGEEFLALLPSTGHEGAVELAEKLRGAISRVTVAGVSRRVTPSFGVAVIPDDAGEPEQALRAADRALYTAKGNGRDRVETAVPADPVPAGAGD